MTYENTGLRCRNCRFWWPLQGADQKIEHLREHAERGECRRHAPEPGAADLEWAIVRKTDWCGEHAHVMS